MISTIASIAAGGALGAVARHGVITGADAVLGQDYPWSTAIVNIAGSFLMGVLVAISMHVWQPSPEIRAFLVVGFLSTFTTFSTFSLDTVMMLERGQVIAAGLYMLGSIILSVGAVLGGLWMVRSIAG